MAIHTFRATVRAISLVLPSLPFIASCAGSTPAPIWTQQLGATTSLGTIDCRIGTGSVSVHADRVYAHDCGKVHVLDLSGKPLWTTSARYLTHASGDRIVVDRVTSEGPPQIASYDAAGRQLWQANTRTPVGSGLVASGTRLFALEWGNDSRAKTRLNKWDVTTGALVGSCPVPDECHYLTGAVGDTVYCYPVNAHPAYAIDAGNCTTTRVDEAIVTVPGLFDQLMLYFRDHRLSLNKISQPPAGLRFMADGYEIAIAQGFTRLSRWNGPGRTSSAWSHTHPAGVSPAWTYVDLTTGPRAIPSESLGAFTDATRVVHDQTSLVLASSREWLMKQSIASTMKPGAVMMGCTVFGGGNVFASEVVETVTRYSEVPTCVSAGLRGRVLSLDAASGRVRWAYEGPLMCPVSAMADGSVLASNNLGLYLIKDGTVLWRVESGDLPVPAGERAGSCAAANAAVGPGGLILWRVDRNLFAFRLEGISQMTSPWAAYSGGAVAVSAQQVPESHDDEMKARLAEPTTWGMQGSDKATWQGTSKVVAESARSYLTERVAKWLVTGGIAVLSAIFPPAAFVTTVVTLLVHAVVDWVSSSIDRELGGEGTAVLETDNTEICNGARDVCGKRLRVTVTGTNGRSVKKTVAVLTFKPGRVMGYSDMTPYVRVVELAEPRK